MINTMLQNKVMLLFPFKSKPFYCASYIIACNKFQLSDLEFAFHADNNAQLDISLEIFCKKFNQTHEILSELMIECLYVTDQLDLDKWNKKVSSTFKMNSPVNVDEKLMQHILKDSDFYKKLNNNLKVYNNSLTFLASEQDILEIRGKKKMHLNKFTKFFSDEIKNREYFDAWKVLREFIEEKISKNTSNLAQLEKFIEKIINEENLKKEATYLKEACLCNDLFHINYGFLENLKKELKIITSFDKINQSTSHNNLKKSVVFKGKI